jgi:hypothetical protein
LDRIRPYYVDILIAIAITASLAVEMILLETVWPTDWPPAAQASLVGVLLTTAGGGVSILVKAAFDRSHLDTQHRLSVREKLLTSGYTYSCDYLMPLASSAGELASHLREYLGAKD